MWNRKRCGLNAALYLENLEQMFKTFQKMFKETTIRGVIKYYELWNEKLNLQI